MGMGMKISVFNKSSAVQYKAPLLRAPFCGADNKKMRRVKGAVAQILE